MADRDNHYEAAFEAYLREHAIAYVAVDEARRALVADRSLKSVDFIVSAANVRLLVDIKGRQFPAGRRKEYWRNWSTRDDLRSLAHWEQLFGPGFCGVFVFAYQIVGDRAPLPVEELFAYRERLYGFVGIRLCHYAAHARLISPKWDTVAINSRDFRQLAAPISAFLQPECVAAAR